MSNLANSRRSLNELKNFYENFLFEKSQIPSFDSLPKTINIKIEKEDMDGLSLSRELHSVFIGMQTSGLIISFEPPIKGEKEYTAFNTYGDSFEIKNYDDYYVEVRFNPKHVRELLLSRQNSNMPYVIKDSNEKIIINIDGKSQIFNHRKDSNLVSDLVYFSKVANRPVRAVSAAEIQNILNVINYGKVITRCKEVNKSLRKDRISWNFRIKKVNKDILEISWVKIKLGGNKK